MAPKQSGERIYGRVPWTVKRDLNAYLIKSGKAQSQVFCEALVDYLQRVDGGMAQAREDEVIAELKKCTNRTCSMLARLGIDVSVMSSFMYEGLNDEGKKQYSEAYRKGVRRIRAKLTPDENEVRDQLAS